MQSAAFLIAAAFACGAMVAWALARSRARIVIPDKALDAAIMNIRDAVIIIDGRGRVVVANANAAILFGYGQEQILGLSIDNLLPDVFGADGRETRKARNLETTARHHGGEGFSVRLRTAKLADDGSQGSVLVLVALQENPAEDEELQRYRRGQGFAKVGTWEWNIEDGKLFWSDDIYSMFGIEKSNMEMTYDNFCSTVHPDDRQMVSESENACLAGDKGHDVEYRVIWPDGTIRWVHETGDVLFGADGKPDKFTGIIRDVTAQKMAEKRIEYLAHFDALTGLPNRVTLHTRMAEAIERAKRHGTMVALAYLDLDKFKPVNDSYGHSVGDKVLFAVGKRIKNAVRAIDTVSRVGGDEFVILLEDIRSEVEVLAVVEKLHDIFNVPITVDNDQHHVGVSIGIGLYPNHATEIEELLHVADIAMYEAKAKGGNGYEFGHPGKIPGTPRETMQ